MTHPRKVIRTAVAVALDASPLAAILVDGRVWTSRAKPLSAETVPAAIVYTPTEKTDKGSYGGDGQGPLIRELTVAIELVDLADDDDEAKLEDRLDDLALLVEAALDGFVIPGRLADNLRYNGMDSDLYERGGHVYGAKLITYTVEYRTATRPAGDASLFPVATATVTFSSDNRALLPAGTGPVATARDLVVDGYDSGVDYDVDLSGPAPVLVRLPDGMIPAGGRVELSYPLPRPSSPSGIYLGQVPDVGVAHADDYTRVAP